MIKRTTNLIFLLFSTFFLAAQGNIQKEELLWKSPHIFKNENSTVSIPNCASCQLLNGIPFYSKNIPMHSEASLSLKIESFSTQPISSEEMKFLIAFEAIIPSTPDFQLNTSVYKGTRNYFLEGVPFIKENGVIQKITQIDYTIVEKHTPLKAKSFVTSSVLGDFSKKWYKIAITTDGLYKIDKAFLNSVGIDVDQVNPKHINIYGNASGRLSIRNSDYRPDDLIKNAIYVAGESDNSFDNGDYILFYAHGPSKWSYSSGLYRRDLNPYTFESYYYICIDANEPPLRIGTQNITQQETATVTSYDYSLVHEQELINLLSAGQRFYGEEFDSQLIQEFNFSIPNYVSTNADLYVSYAAQGSSAGSTIKFYQNNSLLNSNNLPSSGEEYARAESKMTFMPNNSTAKIKIEVNRSNPNYILYLDKIEIFAKRNLVFNGGAMSFRTTENIGAGNISKYVVSNVSSGVEVWDITNRTKPVKVEGELNGFEFAFKSVADTIREFVAFNSNAYLTPTFVGQVAPQNLHALNYAEILVVTNSKFLSYANQLADLHREIGQSVHVVTTEQVFNEFSGGQKDPVAIRQFAKMFYDRANGNPDLIPENLILFGSGTYDPREISGLEDVLLTYQAVASETSISAFTSDDFFVVLDDAESFTASDKLDMGIGRMLAGTNEEASILLSKVKTYIKNMYENTSTLGDWRNTYTMIADDEDYFLEEDCEKIYDKTKTNHPTMNATKIYADAYPQQISAGGIRFPQMEADINRKVEEGSLVMLYVGHGGPRGGGQERFINHEQIKSWVNPDKLHLFVSATCDFARVDDPSIISAGTLNLHNPKGGAIALMTTSRSIYYTVNTDVDSNFFNVVFTRDANYRPLTLGQIFKEAKNGAGSGDNKRSFMLVGDPALRLALPKFKVITDSLNGIEISNATIDTLKALSKITIKGHIADATNNLMSNFNGIIVPSVFDKEKLNKTLGQKANITSVMDFYTQNNVLFRGNVSVVNGKFEFSFIVPKDINYQYGKGKISYYADNNVIDAGGATTEITVGGLDPNGVNDNTPPIIEAYLNDEKFVNGGLTDEDPVFKANLKDDFGINAVGNGVGHDITLVMDGDEANPIILNNYYVADLDSYQSGKINYPMKGISEGPHKLKLKVWDVNNNPAEFNLDFVVAKKQELSLSHVLNYPNPFTTNTEFYFEHNQFGELLEAQIQIFTVSGKLVKTINSYVQTSGFRSDGISWDGRDDFGDQLAKGVYVYTLTVKNSLGNKVQKTEKLVILK